MLKTRLFFLAAVAFLLVASSSVYSQKNPQTVFELEGKIDSPVSIPADVIAVLKSDERVDACFKTEGAGSDEQTWFEASAYDLNNDQRLDLIIKPKNACLFGANQGPFWIFQNRTDGYQKVLEENGLTLTIMPRKTGAFSGIMISKVAAMKSHDTHFHFSQGKYRSSK